MRLERITPGRRAPARLAGAILARDLTIGDERWAKGRRLSADDLHVLATADHGPAVSVIVPEAGELHEDDAAMRLATAVAGPGLTVRGPAQSRVDLLAAFPGVLNVRIAELERVNRIDPLEVFTAFDGQVVEKGDLVASVKVAPHLVDAATVDEGARVARFAGHPLVWVAPFIPGRVGVVVKESLRAADRTRFEASVRAKVEGLGSELVAIDYVDDTVEAVEASLATFTQPPDSVELILTAGGASTDPADAYYVAITRLGGRMVRRGVPAHPGSMLWLARIGRTAILGLPTCGAYSKATAADLLLPRLLSGEPASERTVAKLGLRRDPHPQPAIPVPTVRPGAGRAGRLGAKQRQDRQDPAMLVRRLFQTEFAEDRGHVCLDGALGNDQPVGDRSVGEALGDQRQDFAFAGGQVGQGIVPPLAPEET